MTEINIGADIINVKTSKTLKLENYFELFTKEGNINLKVDIIADFENIPEQYHEVFLNMLTATYYRKVSFGDNPFSECKPLPPKRWWEFWKKSR
jgi:hypothetical protein